MKTEHGIARNSLQMAILTTLKLYQYEKLYYDYYLLRHYDSFMTSQAFILKKLEPFP